MIEQHFECLYYAFFKISLMRIIILVLEYVNEFSTISSISKEEFDVWIAMNELPVIAEVDTEDCIGLTSATIGSQVLPLDGRFGTVPVACRTE